MAFCKICVCGEKIVFDRRLAYPERCPSCGRRTVEYATYNEDDPRVEELLRAYSGAAGQPSAETAPSDAPAAAPAESPAADSGNGLKRYVLMLSNGKQIAIPDEGCIIGRTETGAEELAEFGSVSRQHLRATPRRNIGLLIEDLSSYGTLVDGKKLVKNTPVRVNEGARITLCDLEAVLAVKEVKD